MFILGSLEKGHSGRPIELFSLGVTAEALRAKIDRKSAISLQRGQFDSKFQVKARGRPHQPFLFSGNYAKWSFV